MPKWPSLRLYKLSSLCNMLTPPTALLVLLIFHSQTPLHKRFPNSKFIGLTSSTPNLRSPVVPSWRPGAEPLSNSPSLDSSDPRLLDFIGFCFAKS